MTMSGKILRRDVILVVDDSPETLGFLTKALEMAGIDTLTADSGIRALEILKEITPNLVLLDAAMAGLDGFETCRRLKADRRVAHVPVVFMTGLSETEHVIEGLNAGGVDYVTKPIIIDELMARIRVHLGNARVAHGARTALDVTGRVLFVTDETGRLLWCTVQAESLLSAAFVTHYVPRDGLPPEVSDRLTGLIRAGMAQSAVSVRAAETGRQLEITFVSEMQPGEYLFRLAEDRSDDVNAFLRQHLPLTQRETDVLIWISRGKSNRDISEILDISPRTVNKHLEQIFTKLGVENRSSAAAQATRILALRN